MNLRLFMSEIILGLLLTSAAFSQETIIVRGGLDKMIFTEHQFAKMISIGYKSKGLFQYKLEGGGWGTNRAGEKAGGFVGISAGMEVISEHSYMSFFVGPAGITHPDVRLSGHFQFQTDFDLGLIDKSKWGLGINWKHFSNAGLRAGNRGRDFFSLTVRIPF